MTKLLVNLNNCLIISLFLSSICYSQKKVDSPLPNDCRQLLVVITDSITSTSGSLFYFERKNSKWKQISEKIPVVIGRNGLGWGRGLNPIDSSALPIKTEGDGRSPAGVFELGSAFGYASEKEMIGLKVPYIHITEMVECIDDIESRFYNKIILRDEIPEIDWRSSEKMYFADIWYEQGVIINHNIDPIITGAGSCIFLHNWSIPNETTSGCTEMEPVNMKEIIYWLNSSAHPFIVQLTKQLYTEYQTTWDLPEINEIIE